MNQWLVTGAGGFMGQEVLMQLSARGHHAATWSMREENQPAIIEADTVLHLAGKTGVADSWKDPAKTFEANFTCTLRALEWARTCKAHFVYVSTAAYGASAPRPTPETEPLLASNPYSQSKRLGEELCLSYRALYGVSVSIARVFNITARDRAMLI